MTHALTIRLGGKADLAWAQRVVTEHHYLRQPVDARARPMVYVIDQVLRILAGGEYDEVICTICAGDDGPDTYEWDKGIVP